MPDGIFSDWFVLRTQPNRERYAAENVFRAGFEYYLPQLHETVRIVRRGERRREFRVKPLFPSYLFARSDNGQWHALASSFGVASVLMGGGERPALMKASALEALRAREENGLIVLPTREQGFRENQPVRVTSGAYSGFLGLVKGISANERIQVLIDYMGRKVPFLVRAVDLELAA